MKSAPRPPVGLTGARLNTETAKPRLEASMSGNSLPQHELNIPVTRAQLVTLRAALQHSAAIAGAYANQNMGKIPLLEQYMAEAREFDNLDAHLAEIERQDDSNPHRKQIVYKHHADCPLGENGLRGYWEARSALSNMPPEARATQADRDALYEAEFELERKQVCNCGMES